MPKVDFCVLRLASAKLVRCAYALYTKDFLKPSVHTGDIARSRPAQRTKSLLSSLSWSYGLLTIDYCLIDCRLPQVGIPQPQIPIFTPRQLLFITFG